MDPNSKIYNTEISVIYILKSISSWFEKKHLYHWSRTPDEVMGEFLQHGIDNGKFIKYGEAVKILRTAETAKMSGPANRGIEFLVQEWKKEAKNILEGQVS
jgi:hypothetical protein